MRLWIDRLKVVLRAMAYREAWRLGPRQSLGMLRYLRDTRPTWRGDQAELNVYSPPVGSAAFRRYLRGLRRMARGEWVPLVVHVSVTDRCPNQCQRCSNIAQGDDDPPLETVYRLAEQLKSAGTCRVALTGGEPLLRDDLPAVVEAFGRELSPVLFTSGYGLRTNGSITVGMSPFAERKNAALAEQKATPITSPIPGLSRAKQLRQAGLAAAFVSLDHFRPEEHDRARGREGAFDEAVTAIHAFREAGIYTAAQAVVGPSLLEQDRLEPFLAFCQSLGTDEVMLLEEMPVRDGETDGDVETARGRLAAAARRSARDATMPKVSSMSWLESPECLGCQAGFSFLYVSANGDAFPCDFVPLSFGNIHESGVATVHQRMQRVLRRPSSSCLARHLRSVYGGRVSRPLSWEASQAALRPYDPGPTPELLQFLCHGCNRSA